MSDSEGDWLGWVSLSAVRVVGWQSRNRWQGTRLSVQGSKGSRLQGKLLKVKMREMKHGPKATDQSLGWAWEVS